jgi:hypothetical protein
MICAPINTGIRLVVRVFQTGRYYARQIRLNVKALVLAGRVYLTTRSLRAQKAQIEAAHAKVGVRS